MSKHHNETLYLSWWSQDLELSVYFTYYAGFSGSRFQPAEDPEIEILSATDITTGIDLTDFLTEKKTNQLIELLFEKHQEYVRQAAEARAEALFYNRLDTERNLR